MNGNKQGAGGEVTNPDNAGGLIERLQRIQQAASQLREMLGDGPHCEQLSTINGQAALTAENLAELCRAAPAGVDMPPEDHRHEAVIDAELLGAGFLVDGKRVAPERVEMIRRSAPAGSGEVDDAEALREFTEYFVKNYPGPHTVIMDPNWHAPKIFRAAKRALLRKLQQGADGWIAASERLPERIEGTAHSAEVLVSDGKRVWIHCAYFDWKACERDYWGDTPYVPRLGSGATHWRPLPHASQGQEGE